MKKLLITFLFLLVSETIFSENYTYGLSQDDINLLLGLFIPKVDTGMYDFVTQTFSWGTQTFKFDRRFQLTDRVTIDYSPRAAIRYGKNYERHLIIDDDGSGFLVTKIEKIAANIFELSLIRSSPFWLTGKREAGSITITVLDNYYIIIDNTNLITWGSALHHGKMRRIASPLFQYQSRD